MVQYEGFCIDFLNFVVDILGFKYNIILELSGIYGNCDGEYCDGMVKQFVERVGK